MFSNVTKYVDFLIEHDITDRQFLLCFLLYADAQYQSGKRQYIKQGRGMSSIYKLIAHEKKKGLQYWTKNDIQTLVDKGFVTEIQKGNTAPDMLNLTDKFLHLVVNFDNFEEFWNTYPSFVDNFKNPRSGTKIKLKACDKEELYIKYMKYVPTKDLHERVMDILRWAIENNQISMSIYNYVVSQQWNEDEKLRDEYNVTTTSFGQKF